LVEGRRALKGTRIAWVVASIDQLSGHAAAADASGSPWSPEVMARKLVTYAGNATRPREDRGVFDGRGATFPEGRAAPLPEGPTAEDIARGYRMDP